MTRLTLMKRSAAIGIAVLSFTSCLTISDPPEGLSVFSIVGGNNQTIPVSTTAPSPLVVQTLNEAAGPMGGVAVNWTITSGNGTLGAASTITDDAGNAAITFTAASTPGPVQVRATAEDLRLTFTVNVVSAPAAAR